MKHYFKQPITNNKEAVQFLYQLKTDNLLFHPEDNPRQVCYYNRKTKTDIRLFNNEECDYLDQRIKELYQFIQDPCQLIFNQTDLWNEHFYYLEANNLTYTI